MARRKTSPGPQASDGRIDTAEALAAVNLRAVDWIRPAALLDQLFDDALMALEGDSLLAFYLIHKPTDIVDEEGARWNALRCTNRFHGSDPGSLVQDPWRLNQ